MGGKIVYSVEIQPPKNINETGIRRHPLFTTHLQMGKQGISKRHFTLQQCLLESFSLNQNKSSIGYRSPSSPSSFSFLNYSELLT